MAKKSNKLPDLKSQDPLVPINLASIGTNGDPCFGKAYNLSTKECRACGDSELCAFKMSQSLNKTRKQLEEENSYKDLDVLEDVIAIKKYMRKLKRQGLDRKQIISKTSVKFETPTKTLRKIYKELS